MYLNALTEVDPEVFANDVAVLATNGRDGRPQVSAVWYLVEDGRIRISVNSASQKAKNLRDHPGCSVLIFHPDSTNCYVEVRGDATVEVDTDDAFAEAIGAVYDADMRSHDAPEDVRMVIEVTPSKIFFNDGRG